MSSQRTLVDYDTREPAPGQTVTTASDWSPQGIPRCVCGTRVDAEAARIHGVEGVVPACPACWVDHQGRQRFRTVTKAVVAFTRDGAAGKGGHRRSDVKIDADLHPEVER